MSRVPHLTATPLGGILALAILAGGATQLTPGAEYANVNDLLVAHDRALVRDLQAYHRGEPEGRGPRAGLHDACSTRRSSTTGSSRTRRPAKKYLADYPDGAGPVAGADRRDDGAAQAGKFPEALGTFKEPDGRRWASPSRRSSPPTSPTPWPRPPPAAGRSTWPDRSTRRCSKRYGESPTSRRRSRTDLTGSTGSASRPRASRSRTSRASRFRLEDLRGNYVLVDFWATWCAPCVAELPRVQAAYAKYHDKGFEVVAVSLDETKPAVVDFARAATSPGGRSTTPPAAATSSRRSASARSRRRS